MSSDRPSGEVVTFYSYKGGTGRTMALANVAYLLAHRNSDEKILMLDWDLEAPGLHRFFHGRLRTGSGDNIDAGDVDERPGLMDILLVLAEKAGKVDPLAEVDREARAAEIVASIDLDRYVMRTDLDNLRLIKAGRIDAGYSSRVNTFGWESLYRRLPHIYRALAQRLAQTYRYLLVDSRTGLTDISGICTSLLPEKLVVVFTPNRQSLSGITSLVRSATEYRRKSDDLRPLLVYPLPSRIEFERDNLRLLWRHGDAHNGIDGYQPLFERLFADVYGLRACSLEEYFTKVQIKQSPDFAYGEEIAARTNTATDSISLAGGYMTFLEWLANSYAPWEGLEHARGMREIQALADEESELLQALESDPTMRSKLAELQRQIVDLKRRVVGPEHFDTLASMGRLAETLNTQGDLVSARALEEEVLGIRRRTLGEDHPDTLAAWVMLAGTIKAAGELENARTHFEGALSALHRTLGEEHRETLTAMTSLAEILKARADFDGAKSHETKALEIRRRVLGEGHPETLRSLDELANILYAQGDMAGARRRREEALEVRRKVLGDEHPDTRSSLASLARLVAEMGDRRALQALNEQLAGKDRGDSGTTPGAVVTGGGALVGGNVSAKGDFVGRDRIVIHTGATGERPDTLLQAYYRSLAAECRRLPLGIIDTEFVSVGGKDAVPLPEIYVDLDVIAPPPPQKGDEHAWGARVARGEGGDRLPLLEALAAPENARAVLVGDAGSGKSTFVNYLTYLLLTKPESAPEPLRTELVVRLLLREVTARHVPPDAPKGEARVLWNALCDDIAARIDRASAEDLVAHIRQRLLNQGGLILLDGLDEVPEAQRRRETLLSALNDFMDTLPTGKVRVLLTARPYAYADPRWRLAGYPILALAPFDSGQRERFIARFYQAVRRAMGWSETTAGERGGRLTAALRDKAYLDELAERPLLLTLMATLHSSWGQLPDDRAELMEEAVKLLLGRWQRGREVTGPDGHAVVEPGIAQCLDMGEDRIRLALEALALQTHERQRGVGGEDGVAGDVTEADVLMAFKPLLGIVPPGVLLNYLNHRAGLLIARRDRVYAFPHRSFQEYLAACQLSNELDFAGAIRERLQTDPKWWREVWLLGAGRLKRGGLGAVVGVLNELLPQGPDEGPDKSDIHWHVASLVGQAIVATRLAEKAVGQRAAETLAKRCTSWLMRLLEGGHLSPRDRAEAGDVLGQLGDPRFGPNALCLPARYGAQPESFHGFVEVRAGPFVMGSKKGDEEAWEDEFGNPPSLQLPYGYWIGRYLVTVAQFAAFVVAGGYEEESWWTKLGRRWRSGAYDSQVEEGWLRDLLKQRPAELRGMPWQWADQQRFPNRPVVGVSWFEAAAYAAWLAAGGAQRGDALPTGYVVRLPTEAEWEKAARGGGACRFPWGDEDWSDDRANIDASGIKHPTPVGMYPNGATPSGIHDLPGNVFEWTSSMYRDYPYSPADGRNDADADGGRVVRGGSWSYDPGDARCAYRNWGLPGFFSDDGGFRVVLSLANSGF